MSVNVTQRTFIHPCLLTVYLIATTLNFSFRERSLSASAKQTNPPAPDTAIVDALFAHSPLALALFDTSLRFLRVNERLAELNGRPAQDHVGRHVSEVVPSLLGTAEALASRIVTSGAGVVNHTFSGETTAAPGVTRHWSESWHPILSPDGTVAAILVIIVEVTGQHVAEEALRESEERFRALVETTARAVWESDADGMVVNVQSAKGITAKTPVEWLGDGWVRAVHPDDREHARQQWQAAIAEKTPLNAEYRLLGSNGESRWIKVRAVPLGSPEGTITKWVGMNIDISERKNAEDECHQFVSLAQNSPEFIGMWDLEFRPFFVNDAGLRLVGLDSVQHAREAGVMDFFFEEDREDIATRFFPAVVRDGHASIEVRFRNFKTGKPSWMIYNVFLLTDARGRATGYGTVSQDITERKRMEDALHGADRRKDQFLATLAHELRNPLAPIRNSVEILKLQGAADPPARAARDMIERQLHHMSRLIDDLLDVGRLSAGKLVLKRERTTLAAVVESAIETVRPAIDDAGHRFAIQLPTEPVHLDADPVRLAQVFTNLLDNATKYTGKNGEIALTADYAPDDQTVVVTIADTGIGISPQHLGPIFDMFSQVSPPGHSQGGLGIGLALARALVEMHGGRIEVKSDGPATGTAVIVTLPTVASRSPAGVPAPEQSPRSATRRILVVDDNRDNASSLSLLLGMLGHEVDTASDGDEAIDKAVVNKPEVVLLDLGLPGKSGYDVCRILRDKPGGRGIQIIAMTGWGQDEDRKKSKDAGFDAHLVKPVEPAHLISVLANSATTPKGRPINAP